MAAGNVTIDLVAKTGSFVSDIARAEKSMRSLQKGANDTYKAFKASFAGNLLSDFTQQLASGLAGLPQQFNELVRSAGDFQDLAEEIGASAVDIAGLAVAAGTAGVSIESVASATTKLTKNLVGVDDESKAAGAALKALGLNVAEFKKLDPVGQYEAVAKALSGFADGAQKTAVAQALFGKSGAEQLRVLKALEEQGGRTNILTAEQIRLADEYADRQATLATKFKLYASAVATQFIEPTNALIQVATDAARQLLGLGEASAGIAAQNGIKEFAESAGRSVAELADYVRTSIREIQALGRVASFVGEIAKNLATFQLAKNGQAFNELRRDLDLDAFGRGNAKAAGTEAGKTYASAFDTALANSKRATFAASDPRRVDGGSGGGLPKLNFNGADKNAGKGDNDALRETKRRLDGQIKLIQDAARGEQAALQTRNTLVEGAYRAAEISQTEFFARQKQIRDEALASEVAAIDKEIAVEEQRKRVAGRGSDREQAEQRIALLVQQRAEAVTKAGQQEQIANQQNAASVAQLQSAYQSFQATLAQLSGNDFAANQIRNAEAIARARDLVTQAGGDPGQVDRYAQLLANQTEQQRIQKSYNELIEQTRLKEEAIYIQAEQGGKGQLETLANLGAARREQIGLLQQQVAEAQKLAQAEGATQEQKNFAQGLKNQYQRALGEIDPLAKQINKSLEDSLTGPLEDFITGAKSASDAFDSFAKNLLSQVARIAAQDIAKQIFGGNSGQGGAGGFLSGLFNSSGSSGGSNTNWLASLGSFFGGFFADGGNPPMGKVSVVGEEGPEFFVPKTAGTIIPADLKSPRKSETKVQNNYVSVSPPAGMSRQAAMQLGADISRQLALADRRNN